MADRVQTEIVEWQEVKRQTVFHKYAHRIDRVDFTLPNGSESDYYIKIAGDVVAVVALTTENQVIVARQYRPGPNRILSELPGGGVDPGENLMDAMRRELLEETGYEGDLEYAGKCLDDAYSTLNRQCFVAKNCRKVAEPVHTPSEYTEVELLSVADFRSLLRSGELTDVGVGYLGMDKLGLL